MDPYLERHWRDIHASIIIYARDQLEEVLPRPFVARVEERIVFEVDVDEVRRLYPDVRIVENVSSSSSVAGVAVADRTEAEVGESVTVHFDSDPMTETFLEIHDADKRKVVTVIEFLSETNKFPGEGLEKYRQKQRELRQGKVSLVEIDLIREGKRSHIWPTRRFPKRTRTVYQAVVRRGWKPGEGEIYPVSLRLPLPAIRIPLRKEDKEVTLQLQPLIDQAYRKGRYADTIDYRQPPDPPLEGADAEWADAVLKQADKR
jgi:hypothetical protein